jgi:hypothetical protein
MILPAVEADDGLDGAATLTGEFVYGVELASSLCYHLSQVRQNQKEVWA